MKNNKNNLRFATFFCIAFAAVIFHCAMPVKAEVKLSRTYVALLLGQEGKDTYQLRISGTPKGALVVFSMENENIALVDETGEIAALAPGRTTLTCTITAKDGEKTVKKVSVQVYDNIRSITLGAKDVQQNALHKNTAYALTYTCKTVAGTNKNIGNYIHYEVLTAAGESTQDAAVDSEGNFTAKSYGSYSVSVYAFQSSNKYKEWAADRGKYAGNVLAQDTLVLTVTPTSYRIKTQEVEGFCVTLPIKYEINVREKTKERTAFSAQVKNSAGQNAISNLQVMIDKVEEEQSYALLLSVMASVYTKGALEQSWKSAYNAQRAAVKNLETEKLTAGEREILKISYELTLRNIVLNIGGDNIKISRMNFVNTLYTWYDGNYHISVTVTDAMESLQPNISDAARKMVDNFTRAESSQTK